MNLILVKEKKNFFSSMARLFGFRRAISLLFLVSIFALMTMAVLFYGFTENNNNIWDTIFQNTVKTENNSERTFPRIAFHRQQSSSKDDDNDDQAEELGRQNDDKNRHSRIHKGEIIDQSQESRAENGLRLRETRNAETDQNIKEQIGDLIPHLKNPCWTETLNQEKLDQLKENAYIGMWRWPEIKKVFESLNKIYENRLRREGRNATWLRCLPYFYIIGQPKCGTTDLYHRLALHPQVHSGLIKESNYWSRARFGSYAKLENVGTAAPFADFVNLFAKTALRFEKRPQEPKAKRCFCQVANTRNESFTLSNNFTSRSWMESPNACGAEESVIGDGSITTFWDSAFWMRNQIHSFIHTDQPSAVHYADYPHTLADVMHFLQPDAKFIVILRDPTDRLYSDYVFFKTRFKTGRAMQSDFHFRVLRSIAKFETCVQYHSARHCVYDQDLKKSLAVRLYIGLYSIFLKDWLSVYNRSHVFLFRLEDYSQDTRGVLRQIFHFLGLCEPDEGHWQKMLNFKIRNKTNSDLGPMWKETKKLLDKFYSKYNEELMVLLKDRRYLWNDVT